MAVVVCESLEVRKGRTETTFFGWDSACPTPRRSPSPALQDIERIRPLKLNLSQESTALPPSLPEVSEAPTPRKTRACKKLSSRKHSLSRPKLTLPKGKRPEKSAAEAFDSSAETVDTPSTAAGTADGSSSGFSVRRQSHTEAAAEMLEAGPERLQRAGREPHFSEALAVQGLVLGDILPSSGLTLARRTKLLAAVLQEREMLQRPKVEPDRGARVFQQQLRASLESLADRMRSREEHFDEVARRNQDLANERAEEQRVRARDEEERLQRVRVRDEATEGLRRGRSRERDVHWQGTVERGHEILEARVEDRREFLRQQDVRTEECLARRDEERADRRRTLQEHFENVLAAADTARQEEAALMQSRGEQLRDMFKRSEDHMEALRATQGRQLEQRRQESREREHEVLRVQRAQAYSRARKGEEQREDSALFLQCSLVKEQLPLLARAKAAELLAAAKG